MPQIYSDIEICAKVVCSDMELYRQAIKEFRAALNRSSISAPSAQTYLSEMENCYNRLVNQFGFRPLED